jgi:hypothetical protein
MNLSDFAPFFSTRFWLEWLRMQPPTIGLFLAMGGGLFMFLGLRMTRVAILLTGGLLGLVSWTMLTHLVHLPIGMSAAILLALVVGLGGLSQISLRISTAIFGGLLAAFAVGGMISWANLSHDLAFIAAVVAALCVASLAFVLQEHVVIFTTSLEGSLLLVGGVAIMLNASGGWFAAFRDAALTNPIFIPLTVTAPAVIGFCLQLASFREKDAGRGDA